MNIRVIVADDHPITRAGTISILQRESDIEVVGEAADGVATLALYYELLPDLLLLDVRMPGLTGIEVAQKLRMRPEPPRILLLSGYADPAMVRAAHIAGVTAYALKSLPGHELIARVRHLMGHQPRSSDDSSAPERTHESLTADEMITLCMIAKGIAIRQVAKQRNDSMTIIADQLASVCRKLGARTYPDAVVIAQRLGLLADK